MRGPSELWVRRRTVLGSLHSKPQETVFSTNVRTVKVDLKCADYRRWSARVTAEEVCLQGRAAKRLSHRHGDPSWTPCPDPDVTVHAVIPDLEGWILGVYWPASLLNEAQANQKSCFYKQKSSRGRAGGVDSDLHTHQNKYTFTEVPHSREHARPHMQVHIEQGHQEDGRSAAVCKELPTQSRVP